MWAARALRAVGQARNRLHFPVQSLVHSLVHSLVPSLVVNRVLSPVLSLQGNPRGNPLINPPVSLQRYLLLCPVDSRLEAPEIGTAASRESKPP